MSFVANLRDAIHGFHFADRRLLQLPTPQAAQDTIKSPGLGPTQHTFRRVTDEASKAETALSDSMINLLENLFKNRIL